jgi:hypothetical protein
MCFVLDRLNCLLKVLAVVNRSTLTGTLLLGFILALIGKVVPVNNWPGAGSFED